MRAVRVVSGALFGLGVITGLAWWRLALPVLFQASFEFRVAASWLFVISLSHVAAWTLLSMALVKSGAVADPLVGGGLVAAAAASLSGSLLFWFTPAVGAPIELLSAAGSLGLLLAVRAGRPSTQGEASHASLSN